MFPCPDGVDIIYYSHAAADTVYINPLHLTPHHIPIHCQPLNSTQNPIHLALHPPIPQIRFLYPNPNTPKKMHSLTLLLLFIPLTLTSPTPNPTYSKTLRTLHADLHARQLCDALPTPGQNCAGASLKDVIVTYPTTLPETDAVLMRGVVENAGGRMLYDWKSHGYVTCTFL